MTLTSMSAFQTHAKIVGNVLMRPIDTTACVLMASRDSTVKPTLMNACRCLVFMEGTDFSWSLKTEALQIMQKWLGIVFNYSLCQHSEWRLMSHVVRSLYDALRLSQWSLNYSH